MRSGRDGLLPWWLVSVSQSGAQEILPQPKASGAQLVAVTPELPDLSLSTDERKALEFEVLSDAAASYAKEVGLAFSLPVELRQICAELGGDLGKFIGMGHFDLSTPATLVVETDGEIAFAYVGSDYATRANPDDVLIVVRDINQVAATAR